MTSGGIDKSLFATIRIIALFINADNKITFDERNWFEGIVTKYVRDLTSRSRLLAELTNPPQLAEVFYNVVPSDRQRLLDWATTLMKIGENRWGLAEKNLYVQLKELIEQENRTPATLTDSLVESVNNKAFWNELHDAGRVFNQPLRLGLFGYRPTNLNFYGNRFIWAPFKLIIFIAALLIAIALIAKSCS